MKLDSIIACLIPHSSRVRTRKIYQSIEEKMLPEHYLITSYHGYGVPWSSCPHGQFNVQNYLDSSNQKDLHWDRQIHKVNIYRSATKDPSHRNMKTELFSYNSPVYYTKQTRSYWNMIVPSSVTTDLILEEFSATMLIGLIDLSKLARDQSIYLSQKRH